jgi:dephospho-CoA kinase
MLIGITGQIGTGKSEVARLLEKHGAYVISADQIGREVVEKNRRILRELVRSFGAEILTPSGKLRRRRLGELAFATPAGKRILDKIVHPRLLQELNRQTAQAIKKHDLVVVDAALLVDWQWDKRVQYTVLVHSRNEIKAARLLKKGYSRAEIITRAKSQKGFMELRKHADFIIHNNKSLNSLEVQVEKLIEKLKRKD